MKELSDNTKNNIIDIISSKKMRNIGTGLQIELEEEINSILPADYEYHFSFNISSGETKNIINHKGQLLYRF